MRRSTTGLRPQSWGQTPHQDGCGPIVVVDVLREAAPYLAVAWAMAQDRASAAQTGTEPIAGWQPEVVPAFTGELRRRHWLAGRFVLDVGVRAMGLVPASQASPAALGITDRGSPRLVTAESVPLDPEVQVSIAHSGVHVACAVQHGGEPGLGFDVEEDWDAAARNLSRFSTQEELETLRAACGVCCTPAHLWCVKEAIAKATGWGFTIAPRRYRLLPCWLGAGSLEVSVPGPSPGSVGRLVTRITIGTRRSPSPAAWAVARVWSWAQACADVSFSEHSMYPHVCAAVSQAEKPQGKEERCPTTSTRSAFGKTDG